MRIRLVDKRCIHEPDTPYYQVQVLEDTEDPAGEWRCRDGSPDLEKAIKMFHMMGTPPFDTLHGDYIAEVLLQKSTEKSSSEKAAEYFRNEEEYLN